MDRSRARSRRRHLLNIWRTPLAGGLSYVMTSAAIGSVLCGAATKVEILVGGRSKCSVLVSARVHGLNDATAMQGLRYGMVLADRKSVV